MGCWNKTCGLSNLAIHEGEPVMVFTLVQNNDISDFCYSTALYSPVLLPFYSHYNDYGAGERSSGVGLPLILDGLREHLVEMEQGDNQYHDIPVKRDAFDEDKYWNAIHEGRLKINSYRGERNVQFVMFHKRVVDHILENYVMQQFVKRGDNYEYVDYKFADILASLPPVIESLMATRDDVRRWFKPLETLKIEDNLAAEYLRYSDTYRYSNLIDINNLIQDLIAANDDDLLAHVLIDHLTAKFIDGFMMSTRKVWVPGCHEGSQSCDAEPYHALMNAMTAVLAEDKAKYDYEYGDDDQLDLFLDA
jgi:hypothetical protein